MQQPNAAVGSRLAALMVALVLALVGGGFVADDASTLPARCNGYDQNIQCYGGDPNP